MKKTTPARQKMARSMGTIAALLTLAASSFASDTSGTTARTSEKIADGACMIRHKDSPDTFPLSEAVQRERDLGYWEPPHYTRPVLESLAAAHIRAGRYDVALEAYEKVLKNRPNSGFAYLGIARVHAQAGNRPKAEEIYKRFTASWANADSDLPHLAEAQNWSPNRGPEQEKQ